MAAVRVPCDVCDTTARLSGGNAVEASGLHTVASSAGNTRRRVEMGMLVSFDEVGVVTVVVTGDISIEDALEAVAGIYDDTRFRLPSRILWDLAEGQFSWTPSEIRVFADFVSQNRPEGQGRAAVLVSDERSFGLTRMYELMTGDTPVEAVSFRDRGPAIEWLNEPF